MYTHTLLQRMRRPRRHRWLTVSVFFIAYSVFQAVLSNASEPADDKVDSMSTVQDTKTTHAEPKGNYNIFKGNQNQIVLISFYQSIAVYCVKQVSPRVRHKPRCPFFNSRHLSSFIDPYPATPITLAKAWSPFQGSFTPQFIVSTTDVTSPPILLFATFSEYLSVFFDLLEDNLTSDFIYW